MLRGELVIEFGKKDIFWPQIEGVREFSPRMIQASRYASPILLMEMMQSFLSRYVRGKRERRKTGVQHDVR